MVASARGSTASGVATEVRLDTGRERWRRSDERRGLRRKAPNASEGMGSRNPHHGPHRPEWART